MPHLAEALAALVLVALILVTLIQVTLIQTKREMYLGKTVPFFERAFFSRIPI